MTIPRENFIHRLDSKPTKKVRKSPTYTSLMSNGKTEDGRNDNAVAYIKIDEYDVKEFFIKVNAANKLFDPHFLGAVKQQEGVMVTKKKESYSFAKGNAAAYDYYVRYVIDNSIGMYRAAQREFENAQQSDKKDHVVMTEWDSLSQSERERLGITTSQPSTEFEPSVVKKKTNKKSK